MQVYTAKVNKTQRQLVSQQKFFGRQEMAEIWRSFEEKKHDTGTTSIFRDRENFGIK